MIHDVLADFYQGPIPYVDKQIWNEVVEKDLNGDLRVKKVRICAPKGLAIAQLLLRFYKLFTQPL